MGYFTSATNERASIPFNKSGAYACRHRVIASKQYGSEDILARLVAEAALSVMPGNNKTLNVDNMRVVKIMGDSLTSRRVWYLARNPKVTPLLPTWISRQDRWTFGSKESYRRKSRCLQTSPRQIQRAPF